SHKTDRSRPVIQFSLLDRRRPFGEYSRCSSGFGFRYSNFGFALEHARLLETEIARIVFRRRADDDMIEQLDLQKLGRFGQPTRQAMIGLARRGIAGRMVVYDDDSIGRRD